MLKTSNSTSPPPSPDADVDADALIPTSPSIERRSDSASASEDKHSETSFNAPPSASVSAQKLPRRRVKTGCLTCRKRRIKCGEEKPTCRNCIKSKRICEGYIPGMVYRRSLADTTTYSSVPGPHLTPHHRTHEPLRQVSDAASRAHLQVPPALPSIRAKLLVPGDAPFPSASSSSSAAQSYDCVMSLASSFGSIPIMPAQDQNSLPARANMEGEHYASSWPPDNLMNNSHSPPHPTADQRAAWSSSFVQPPAYPQSPVSQHVSRSVDSRFHDTKNRMSVRTDMTGDMTAKSSWDAHARYNFSPSTLQQNLSNPPPNYATGASLHDAAPTPNSFSLHSIAHPTSYHATASNTMYTMTASQFDITRTLDSAAVEFEDDDYYDVLSEDDLQTQTSSMQGDNEGRNLGALLSIYRAGVQNPDLNSFTYPGVLDSYRPERAANPLRNEFTARVFGHYISNTAPMLSAFQSKSYFAPVLFQEGPVPAPRQTLWNYTLPMMALHNQALLHSMLALSSLHISKVQGASPTPSLKHYAYSLKKVRLAMARPGKRREITTLAATLILGFYEMLTASHHNWTTLLKGAYQLVKEIDFSGMIRSAATLCDELKGGKVASACLLGQSSDLLECSTRSFLANFQTVDETLLSAIAGRDVHYERGHGLGESLKHTTAELARFEILQDLYWWYFKQDVIYGIMGGTHLCSDYIKWYDVPPRAGVGRADAVFGTFDHLMILMARTARFAALEKLRKDTPNSWPSTSSEDPRSPSSQEPTRTGGLATQPLRSTSTLPSRPNLRVLTLPSFQPESGRSTNSARSDRRLGDMVDETDFTEKMVSAVADWQSIRSSFTQLEKALPVDFLPVQASHGVYNTPFNGPALFFRAPDIALFWVYYHMGLIVCHRSHPSAPRQMQAAVAHTATQTGVFVDMICRITAGLQVLYAANRQNNGILCAYSDCLLGLFSSGMQLLNDTQRVWTVNTLLEIGRESGWGSAMRCAKGLEHAWTSAAGRGAGPPYEPLSKRGDVFSSPASQAADVVFKERHPNITDAVNTPIGSDTLPLTMSELKAMALDV